MIRYWFIKIRNFFFPYFKKRNVIWRRIQQNAKIIQQTPLKTNVTETEINGQRYTETIIENKYIIASCRRGPYFTLKNK